MTQENSTVNISHIDMFPNGIAASVDSDEDGYPDDWNHDMTQSDSTTGLYLDEFPVDHSEWAEEDEDGVGNNADAFPEDPAASLDTDSDGYPDKSNERNTSSDSTTGLKLDAYPESREMEKEIRSGATPGFDVIFIVSGIFITLSWKLNYYCNWETYIIIKRITMNDI